MTKLCVEVAGIVRIAPFANAPSEGMSLGGSLSEIFQTWFPLRKSRLSFWEEGDFTQFAKTLLMVIGCTSLFAISIVS